MRLPLAAILYGMSPGWGRDHAVFFRFFFVFFSCFFLWVDDWSKSSKWINDLEIKYFIGYNLKQKQINNEVNTKTIKRKLLPNIKTSIDLLRYRIELRNVIVLFVLRRITFRKTSKRKMNLFELFSQKILKKTFFLAKLMYIEIFFFGAYNSKYKARIG